MHRFTRLTFKVLDLFVIFMMVFGAPMSALAAPQAQDAPPPTIQSDKADYSAGSLVTLTGTGWTGDTTVTIVVTDAAPTVYHDTDQVQVQADGTITDSFNLPTSFVDTYYVTATGAQTGRTATTSFTDAPAAVNLDQCRNGSATSPNDCKDFGGNTGWVNGNVGASQAHMLEGYSTPFRAVMTNLPTGTPIQLVIGYDIRNSGANAYDYLTQYQRLNPHTFFGHPAETVLPTDGVTGFSATTSTFPIPAPSSAGSPVAGQPTTEFNSLAAAQRVMTLFGGTITAMAYVSQGNLTASQSETQVSVNFTVDNPTAVLAWGGHISECSIWGTTNGTCNSAGGISGSPYHMRLISWCQLNTQGVCIDKSLPNLGNTDKSMAASVVVQPGNLTLAKSLAGGPDGYTGPFTINYSCTDGTSGSVSVTAGSSQTVNGIPSGAVCTISETPPTPPTGYTFGTPTFSPSATVTIGAGTTVTVTTNNTLTRDLGSLKLTKSLTGGPQGYTGPFTIVYDCDGTANDGSVQVNAGSSQTVSGIPSGTSCTISEPNLPNAPAGYSFGTPTFSPSATVTIGAGTTVEVTTNNTLTFNAGSLKLTKSLTGGPSDYTGPFTINYDCDGTAYDGSVQVNAGSSQTVSNIPTSTSCTISETLPTPPTGYSFGTPTFNPSATVTIGNGTTVEVITNNSLTRDLGSLVLAKNLTGGPAEYTGPFTINYSCNDGTTGSVSVAAGSSQTVSGIPTGTSCTVSETLPTPPTGYSFGTPTFSPSDTVTIPAGNSSSVTVTTNNTLTRDTGSLQVNKTLDDGGSGFSGNFSINYDCGGGLSGTLTVAPGGSSTVTGIPTGSSCTVTEPTLPAPPTGYSWGTPVITGSPAAITTSGATVEVTVANSLTRDLGSLVLAKSLTGGPAGYTGPFTINYTCTDGTSGSKSVNAGSSETVSDIPTGTECTVSETLPTPPTGYSFGTPSFSPSATVTIPAGNGSSVTVTTNNTLTRDTGSFKITKNTSNPDGATLPTFTGTYNCGTGYTGTWSVADGGSQTVTGIPTGNTCSVTEDALAPISGYTWGTPTFTPSSIVISTKDQTFEIVVGNSITRDRGSLKITKQTSNPDGATLPASFTGTYDCGGGYSGSFSVADGASQTFGGIPTGSVCTVTETTPTPIPGYTWGAITYTPSSITISTNGGTFTIAVGNSITRDRGSLKIYKTLSNPDGASVPASFTVNYDCGTGYTGSVSVAPGSPATVNGIPTGNTCSISEVAPTPIPNYTWGTITYSPDSSVVITDKGVTYELTVGNSITRDRGSLTIVKKVVNDNGGTATVSAFGVNTSAGSLTFDSGVANGTTTTYTSQKMTVVTGNYTLKESDVYGYTEGTWSCTDGTANPTTYNNGSVNVAKDKDVVCTITNNDQPGTIIIQKIVKGTTLNTSFNFTTTGTGYSNFSLSGGTQNSQTVNAGSYSVTESVPLGWVLTGIGGSTDPATPFNCTVTGSGGSTGVGDLNTQMATISLKNGDTVTCVFENTGPGVTRTQGFWATHPQLAQIAWFGGTAFGHTFPGVAAVPGIGDTLICGRPIDTLGKLMGGFWSDISKTSNGGRRSALDQARMQALQQLLAAELNASAFGSVPTGGTAKFGTWEAALCGTNQNAIKDAQQGAAQFNNSGDSAQFTPGTSAQSQYARSIANIPFWDVIKP